jgi:phage terminase small subunit
MKKKLTGRRLKFAELILQNVPGIDAYLKAGFKAKNRNSAGAEASRYLKIPMIAEYVARRRQELTEQLQQETFVTKRDVILELKHLGFSRINRVLSFNGNSVTLKNSDEIADEDLAAIQSVKETKDGIAIKMHDKTTPLIKIGEHLGLFESEELDPDRPRTVDVTVHVYGQKRNYKFNASAS